MEEVQIGNRQNGLSGQVESILAHSNSINQGGDNVNVDSVVSGADAVHLDVVSAIDNSIDSGAHTQQAQSNGVSTTEHPIWQKDKEAKICPRCLKKFTFFNRRHHCRKCGRVFCSQCCDKFTCYLPMSYVVFPEIEGSGLFVRGRLSHARFRTCVGCYDEMRMLKDAMGIVSDTDSEDEESGGEECEGLSGSDEAPNGSSLANLNPTNFNPDTTIDAVLKSQPVEITRKVAIADQGAGAKSNRDEEECPVCGKALKSPEEAIREAHINQCLTQQEFGSPTNNTTSALRRARNRMLISVLPKNVGNINEDNECVICLDDFHPGDKVGRLECLCCFHYHCIKDWINKKGFVECPVHVVHTE